MKKFLLNLNLILLILYLIFRFVFASFIDSFGNYSSYIFELLLVLISILVNWNAFTKNLYWSKFNLIATLVFLFSGFFIYKIAAHQEIIIPFNLTGIETIFFLLVVAPILEEFIFRFFSWEALNFFKTPNITLLTTSLLFSYSHFHPIWNTSDAIHSFIIYQSIYTFFLGLACGFMRMKHHSLIGAIMIHFSFNLGFFLASI